MCSSIGMSSRATTRRVGPRGDLRLKARAMLRALTFDYWDTLYEGGALPERVALRRTAVGALLGAYGRALPDDQLRTLYEESGREAERWWSEEQRGYTTDDRLRWILERADVAPREACAHVA